jgi:hypothetical protein
MLSGQLLRSGNLRDYTALGGVGYPVYAAAAQIRTAVAKQLGQEYADFLAVPQFDSKGETIDWYAAVDGDVVPWAAASESERAFMRSRLQEISARIEEHAAQIQATPRSNDQLVFGRLLALSMRIPDDSHIYLVNGKPLVTFWGFVPAGGDTNKHVLADLPVEPAAQPVAPVATPVAASASSYARHWWWLLLLPLLLLLLLFGLRSCTQLQPLVPYLPEPVQDLVRDPDAPQPDILVPGTIVPGETVPGQVVPGDTVPVVPGTVVPGETGVSGAEPPVDGAMAPDVASDGTSPVDEPRATSDSGASPPEDPNADATSDASSASEPPANPDAPGSTDPAAPDPAAPDPAAPGTSDAVPPLQPLSIPDQESKQGDASFMEGNWRSQTGLRSKNAKAPVSIDYAFDKSGKGTTTLRMPDGVSCTGASTSTTSNGRMIIKDDGQLNCSNGSSFAGSEVECVKGSDNQTKCIGRYPNGQTYDITLGR